MNKQINQEQLSKLQSQLGQVLVNVGKELMNNSNRFDCAESAIEQTVLKVVDDFSISQGLEVNSTLLLSNVVNAGVDELVKRQESPENNNVEEFQKYIDEACEVFEEASAKAA